MVQPRRASSSAMSCAKGRTLVMQRNCVKHAMELLSGSQRFSLPQRHMKASHLRCGNDHSAIQLQPLADLREQGWRHHICQGCRDEGGRRPGSYRASCRASWPPHPASRTPPAPCLQLRIACPRRHVQDQHIQRRLVVCSPADALEEGVQRCRPRGAPTAAMDHGPAGQLHAMEQERLWLPRHCSAALQQATCPLAHRS